MTTSPSYRLDCIWIRSRRLKPAIRFYSAIWGWPVVKELFNGEIYVFHLTSGRKLLLDDIRAADNLEPDAQPVAIWAVPELAEAHRHTARLGFAHISAIQNGVDYSYYSCRDTDGNLFAVADRPFPYPGTAGISRDSPIEPEISAISATVSDAAGASAFYKEWLGIPEQADALSPGERYGLPLQEGGRLELTARNSKVDAAPPFLQLQSNNLLTAYKHLKAAQIDLLTGPTEAERGQPILFKDCDGRLLEVSS